MKVLILLIPIFFILSCSQKQSALDLFYSNINATCVSFIRQGEKDHYIGYRIVEHEPEITENPISNYAGQPTRLNYPPPIIPDSSFAGPIIPEGTDTDQWLTQHQDEKSYFQSFYNGVALFRYQEAKDLYRVVVLKTAADGVNVWAWLESEKEIPGSYVVQACYRFSGNTNSNWRHKIALVPEMSEYDLWESGNMKSLTWVHQKNTWFKVEATKEQVHFYTPAGANHMQQQNITIKEENKVPYGLIIRESIDESSIAGMYWDRTTCVSVHYPADCLHAFVDLGSVKPGEKNIVHGKLYWFKGNKNDLLSHWKKDFK